jgi:hypothetical protein
MIVEEEEELLTEHMAVLKVCTHIALLGFGKGSVGGLCVGC